MKKMTKDQRQENKSKNAACNRCGGWTTFGGMSQYSNGVNGCTCKRSKSVGSLSKLYN